MSTALELINNIIPILSKNTNVKKRYNEDIVWLENRKEKWRNNRVRVGIIGITSSGKSTLINAIMGKQILSTAVVPNSSSITSCFYGNNEKLIIYFNDGRKKEYDNVLPKNILQYNDERYNENNKNRVEFLEIYTPYFSLDKDIELIDSPGLEAYGLEYHEELTLDTLLPTIDICIYVTTTKTNSDDKTREIINKIASRNIPIVIVQNMLDSVLPNIEGTKSADEVALEHKNRLIRIINNSNINDKQSVVICQLSSILILRKKTENINIEKKYEDRFDEFVSNVNKLVNDKKPNIDEERIDSIISKFDLLISDEKKRLSGINYNIKFQYEGYDSKINKAKEDFDNNIEKLFNLFSYDSLNSNNTANKNNSSSSSFLGIFFNALSEMTNVSLNSGNIEDKVKKTKEMAHNFEKGITETIKNYYNFLINISKELNIPPRDITFSQVNVSQYNLEVQKDKKPVKRWRDKPGFFAGVARFFDWGNNNWGKEEITEYETEINKEATEKNIKEYIQRIKSIYSKTIEEYYNQFSFITGQFDLALERERRSYEDKQKNLLSQKETKSIIEELDNLLRGYRSLKKHNNINKSKKEETTKDNNISLEEIEIDDYIYNFSLLSEYIIYSFNDEVMKNLLNHLKIYKANDMIIGWDSQSISLFIKRFFNKIVEINDKMKNYVSSILKDSPFSLNLLYSPNEINISFNRYNNIYLMLNAQIGFNKKQIKDIKLLDKLSNSNFLFLVIEDFEQLINSNSFTEMLSSILDFKEEIEKITNCKSIIIINSENPIYNLSFIEHQLKPCKNLQDEIKLIGEIEKEYSIFLDKNVSDNIANILRIRK
ncbi:dynamin family protein [Brachyspira alvinipulli]|uniref:dynamin family protein n=1 Tax=Brachyspira alvinipulli TaxID=84379 RepID=UPI000489F9CD|nr:dynamin family protein [Brachyspira alvinipulli]